MYSISDQQKWIQILAALGLPAGSVTSSAIANGAVGTAQLANGAVGAPQLANNAVTDIAVAATAAIQSSKLAYTQGGTGAVSQTVQNALRLLAVTPDDFGAVGNGTTDDLAAFNLAVAYIAQKGGGTLFIPAKRYYLSNALVINQAIVEIRGASRQASQLVFGATDGIVFTAAAITGSVYQGLSVSDLSILTTNTASNTGLNGGLGTRGIAYGPLASNTGAPFPTSRIVNVEIRGDNGFTQYWNTGIHIYQGVNVIIDRAVILGCFNRHYQAYGILFQDLCINNQVTNGHIYYCDVGIQQQSHDAGTLGAEGLQVIGCQIVGVGAGVSKDNNGATTTEGRPLTMVIGCHINATRNCVVTSYATETIITGNLFYIQDGVFELVTPGAACVALGNPKPDSVHRHTIGNNLMRALAGSTSQIFGVVVDTQYVKIDGVFSGFQYGVIITANASNVLLGACVFEGMLSGQIQNQTTGKVIRYTSTAAVTDNATSNPY
jgi:hypothetical protein